MFEFSVEAGGGGGDGSDLQILPSKNHPGGPDLPPADQPSHQGGSEGTIEKIDAVRDDYQKLLGAVMRFLRADFLSHWFLWGPPTAIALFLAYRLLRKR
jgi:hypothetical protein